MSQLKSALKSQPPHQLNGARILVVDDNHASRLVAKAILEREACLVTLAQNGLTSVHVADQKDFDLILMDIQMPDISGVEAARRIKKKSHRNAKTPIIALTAYSDSDIQIQARDAGIVETLTKPLRVGQMKSALSRVNAKDVPQKIEHKLSDQSEAATSNNIIIPSKGEALNLHIITPLLETASPAMFETLYKRFNGSAQAFLMTIDENMQYALQDDSAALGSLRRAAHALKGAASSVGFVKLSAQAARVQNANQSELIEVCRPLKSLLAEANAALKQKLNSPKADL